MKVAELADLFSSYRDEMWGFQWLSFVHFHFVEQGKKPKFTQLLFNVMETEVFLGCEFHMDFGAFLTESLIHLKFSTFEKVIFSVLWQFWRFFIRESTTMQYA